MGHLCLDAPENIELEAKSASPDEKILLKCVFPRENWCRYNSMFKAHVTVTAVSLGAAPKCWGPRSVLPVFTIFNITSVSQRNGQGS